MLGDLGEALDDGAGVADDGGQFDLADEFGAAQGEADDVRGGDAADAGGGDGDAEAGADECEDSEPVGGFLNDLGTEAVLFEEGEGFFEGAGAGAARVVDEGVAAEGGGGDALLPGAAVRGGEDGDVGLGEDGSDGEAFGGVAVAEDAGVEGSVFKSFHDAGGEGLMKMEVDAGEGLAEGTEDAGEGGEHAGADEADIERADLAATDAAGFVDVALDVAEGAACAFEEGDAGVGEGDGARGADEEGVAEDLFEFADLLGERRLREVETFGGATEVKLLGDGDEVAEVA